MVNVATTRNKARLLVGFSLAVTFVWPLSARLHSHFLQTYLPWNLFIWFCCLAMVALSMSRFQSVVHPYPLPEVFLLLWPIGLGLMTRCIRLLSVDQFLLAFDRNYGYAEMPIARILGHFSVVDGFIRAIYMSMMLVAVLLYLALPPAEKRRFAKTIPMGVIIVPMYMLCPGTGPAYLLGNNFYQWTPAAFQPHLTYLPQVLNTTPSGHFAGAILLFWFARKYCSRRIQIAIGVFTVLTCISTLETGEHYIIDLVLSVPYAALIWTLAHLDKRALRGQLLYAGIAVIAILAWLVMLRGGWALTLPPVLVWILTGLTISPFALYKPEELCARPVVDMGMSVHVPVQAI